MKGDKLLNVLLKFSLDKKSVQDAEREFGSLENALAQVDEEALALSSTIETALFNALDQLEKKTAKTRSEMTALREQAERLQSISMVALGAGTAITGGIFGLAQSYVSSQENPNELTRQWKQATDSMEESWQRIGKVAAEEFLPVIEKSAEIAEMAAGFIEQHPDAIQSALKIGSVLVALGAVGTAVSKGIKLYADAKTLLASANQLIAANKMEKAAAEMLAASLGSKGGLAAGGASTLAGGGAATAGMGSAAASIGSALVLAVAAWVGANVGDKIADVLVKEGSLEEDWKTFREILAISAGGIISSGEKLANAAGEFLNSSADIETASSAVSTKLWEFTKNILGLSEKADEETIAAKEDNVEAIAEFAQKEAEIYEKYNTERADIINQAASQMVAANGNLSSALATASQNLQTSLAKAATNYYSDLQKIDADHAQKKSDIASKGNAEIERIEFDHKEKMRQMQMDHDQRISDLIEARDALGLAKENEQFGIDQSEEERAKNIKIEQKRADIQAELAEENRAYAEKRQQRAQQYAQEVKEAQLRYKEEVEAANKQHQEDMLRIEQEKADRLAELQKAYNEERAEFIKAKQEQLGDLQSALEVERSMKQQAYVAMQSDIAQFVESLDKISTKDASQVKAYASGGYLDKEGLFRGGENGREFVLDNPTTLAMEKMVGGRLTQNNVRNASRSMVYQDNRNFSGMSRDLIETIKNELFVDLEGMVANAG